MSWTELKRRIYYEDGSLRDIYVLNVSLNDLRKWTDLMNQNYRIEFYDSATDLTTDQLSFNAIEETWINENREFVTASILIGAIKINCHFYDKYELENDIDPREFKSLSAHENLMKYLQDVSKLLDKEVIVTEENTKDLILIRVRGDAIILNST